ncbi:unnamed protein product [Boreogadus saida]
MVEMSMYMKMYPKFLFTPSASMRSTRQVIIIIIIVIRLSGVGSRGEQLKQGAPDFPFPGHIDQLGRGGSRGVPRPVLRYNLKSLILHQTSDRSKWLQAGFSPIYRLNVKTVNRQLVI